MRIQIESVPEGREKGIWWPMITGDDGASAPLTLGGSGTSGPPHTVTILVSSENAARAVETSEGSRAKCSTVAMIVSKMGWFAEAR